MSTRLMLRAAEILNLGREDRLKLRLGLAGWMMAAHDHSFIEVLMAARGSGLPMLRNVLRPIITT